MAFSRVLAVCLLAQLANAKRIAQEADTGVLNATNQEEPSSTSGSLRLGILRAKYNFKYKQRKVKPGKALKPRVNKDDLEAIDHMLRGTAVTYSYDPTTNDLWFDTHTHSDTENDIVIDGEDTGGQLIRLFMSLAINKAGGREESPAPLRAANDKKACMLYVQGVMFTLKVGQSMTVEGGDPSNPDAPTPTDWIKLFDILRSLLGVSYRLEDLSEASNPKFVLTREADADPAAEWTQGEGLLSIYLMDQILNALVFFKLKSPLTLRGQYDPDFHIAAMVRVLRLFGHKVKDEVVPSPEFPKDKSKSQRVVSIG